MAFSKDEVLAGLAKIIYEETNIPVSSITADRTFTSNPENHALSMDIDSISVITILTHAEEHFSVRIPEEIQGELRSVGEVVDFIFKAQG